MKTVEDIVRIDSSSCNIELKVVITTSWRHAIPRIKNAQRYGFLMHEERVIPEVYVTTIGMDQTASGNIQNSTHMPTQFPMPQTYVNRGFSNKDHGLDDLDEQYPFQQDGDGDSDGYGHDQRGSSPVPRPSIIFGADNYLIQTINNDESLTTDVHFYKALSMFLNLRSAKHMGHCAREKDPRFGKVATTS
ncbi:hypothetical protein Q3G72_031843 [Acer saccharum]|nr:hypothetical protein Q3G72_031843 [Acer saccharum]